MANKTEAPISPAQNRITLETPIPRGDDPITSITLRKPAAGELRGVALSDLLRLDVAALITVLPRISTPALDGNPELLDQIPKDEKVGTVTADGAYDTRRCHTAIIERDAVPIIPIRRNGRPWKEDCPAARVRNETLRTTRHYGRAFWKRWTGYHTRSRIEAKMRCLKAFGERIAARDPDRQTAEIHIRIALMNRFNALGTAEIVRVA